MSNGVKRRNMRLKNCLFTSLSISSILLFASGQQIFAEETEVNDVITPATPEVTPEIETANSSANAEGQGNLTTDSTNKGTELIKPTTNPEETGNQAPATEQETPTTSQEHNTENLANSDFVRNSFHVGAITEVRQNNNIIELDYETGHKGRLYFYDDHVIRYYVDREGNFVETPEPSRSDRPAEIVVKSLSDYEQITPTLQQTADKVTIATNAVVLELDKRKSTMSIRNTTTNKVVLQEVAPLEMTASTTTQTLKSNDKAQYFGGGTQNGRFTHKGEIINIVNENRWTDGGVASPSPFYWSTDGYGVLRHTFKQGKYDFEKSTANTVSTTHNENRFDAFYFINPSPVGILKDYYKLTGDPVVMPIYSLYQGHLNAYNRDYWVEAEPNSHGAVYFDEVQKWYREYQPNNLGNRQGILETLNGNPGDANYPFTARAVVDRYERNDMPLGWILVNDGYGAGYGQTDTLEGNIQNLREFSKYALEKGVVTGLWTQSDLHPDSSQPALLQRDLPNEVKDGLVRVLKTDVAWVGPGYSFGLNGIKDAANIIKEKGNNARSFIITLDGWGGTQRYGGIWTGDQTGGEWEYIRFHVPTYIGTGLSGNPNVSSDMDGIFGGGDKIINTRDFQWKTFTTMQLNMDGWGYNPKTPFAFDQTTTDINRTYLKLKSALVPYSYSISHEAVEGTPIVQAMFIEFPNEAINYTDLVRYQYMYGKNFLVAPVYENVNADSQGNDVRNGIYLPAGATWIDYFTGKVYEGGQMLNNFEAPIWKQPVFVRNGAIIPVTNPHNNYKEINHALRQVDFYPHGETSFTLYEDDGVSNAYQEGQVAKTLITSNLVNGTATLTISRTESNYADFVKQKATQFNVNVSAKPTALTLRVGDETVELQEVDTLEAFNSGTNVYFYDAMPNLNQFSTEGSALHGKSIIKNPVVRVKTALNDVTQKSTILEVQGFVMNNPAFVTPSRTEGEAPTISAVDDQTTFDRVALAWNQVENATSYDLKVDGILYTNIKTNAFVHKDLKPETTHKYQVRAIVGDAYTQWSNELSANTKENPLALAVDNVTASTSAAYQNGTPLSNLVDKDITSESHSSWTEDVVPNFIYFDLKLSYELDRLEYHPRTVGSNGIITRAAIWHSDDNIHWQQLESRIEWVADNTVKTYRLPDGLRARYYALSVEETAGNRQEDANKFISGQELFFFRKETSLGNVVGDISGNKIIDENDVTSFQNYAGLRRNVDSDFEGYVEVADLNKNGVIDAYDIYFVTRQLGEGNRKPTLPPTGAFSWKANKETVAEGEEVVYTITGHGMTNVEAIHANFNIDTSLYEVVDSSVTVSEELSSMSNFSRVRTHGDRSVEAFVILANRKDSPTVSGTKEIAQIRLRARRAHTPTLTSDYFAMIGTNLLSVSNMLSDSTPLVVPVKVENSRITVTGENVYQPGYDVSKLNDSNLESLTELLWDYEPNYVEGKLPEAVKLPQSISFEIQNGESVNLESIAINKRTPGNGTLTKYRIETYNGDQLIHRSQDISVPFAQEEIIYRIENIVPVTKVILVALEARTDENSINNRMLTLREVSLYAVETPIVQEPKQRLFTNENYGINVEMMIPDSLGITDMTVEDVNEEDLGKFSEVLRGADADLFSIKFNNASGDKVNVTTEAIVTMPVDEGKEVARVIYYDLATHSVQDLTEFEHDKTANRVTFVVPHFSIYGVIYKQAGSADSGLTTPKPGVPTPKPDVPIQQPSVPTPKPGVPAPPVSQPGTSTSQLDTLASKSDVSTPQPNTKKLQSNMLPSQPNKARVSESQSTPSVTPQSTKQNDQATLPATGEGQVFTIFGTAALSILASLGMVKNRKKEKEE